MNQSSAELKMNGGRVSLVKEHGSKGEPSFMYYGLLGYAFLFYSQIGARFHVLAPLRLELVVGSILIIVASTKFIKGEVEYGENNLNGSALFFILAALATIPFAAWPTHALETFIRLLKFFAIYLMIVCGIDSEKKLRTFIYLYLAMICLLFVQPFLFSLVGKGFVYNNHMWRLAGVTGYFSHPNQLGGITSANLPFFYFLMKYQKSFLRKIAFLSLIGISLRVIMLTLSRTAFVGVIAFGLAIAVTSKRKVLSLFLIGICCVFVWQLAPEQTRARFLTFKDVDEVVGGTYTQEQAGSMAARWTLVKHAFSVFLERPIVGAGLDCFKFVSLRKWRRSMPPHNTFLQALAEMGLIGFAAFCIVIIFTFKNLIEARKNLADIGGEGEFLRCITEALIIYFGLRLVVSSFGQDLYANYWWLAGGLSVVTLRISKQGFAGNRRSE